MSHRFGSRPTSVSLVFVSLGVVALGACHSEPTTPARFQLSLSRSDALSADGLTIDTFTMHGDCATQSFDIEGTIDDKGEASLSVPACGSAELSLKAFIGREGQRIHALRSSSRADLQAGDITVKFAADKLGEIDFVNDTTVAGICTLAGKESDSFTLDPGTRFERALPVGTYQITCTNTLSSDDAGVREVSIAFGQRTSVIASKFDDHKPLANLSLQLTAPATAIAGDIVQVSAKVIDDVGQVSSLADGQILTLTTTDSCVEVSPEVVVQGGEATLPVQLCLASKTTLTVSNGDGTLLASVSVLVAPGNAAGLDIVLPAGAKPDVPFNFDVVAIDAFGNTAPNYTGTVVISSNASEAVIPQPHTFTAAEAGRSTFSMTFHSLGQSPITAIDAASGFQTTRMLLVFDPNKVTQLHATAMPTGVNQAGNQWLVQVELQNALGQGVTSASGSIDYLVYGTCFTENVATVGAGKAIFQVPLCNSPQSQIDMYYAPEGLNQTLYVDVLPGPPTCTNIRYVSASAPDDSSPGCDPLLPKKTIGSALAVTTNGDEIWVTTGIYEAALSIDKSVTVKGGYDSAFNVRTFTGSAATIVHPSSGQASTPAITIGNSANVVLDGLLIDSAYMALSDTASVVLVSTSSVTINACRIATPLVTTGKVSHGVKVSPLGAVATITNSWFFLDGATGTTHIGAEPLAGAHLRMAHNTIVSLIGGSARQTGVKWSAGMAEVQLLNNLFVSDFSCDDSGTSNCAVYENGTMATVSRGNYFVGVTGSAFDFAWRTTAAIGDATSYNNANPTHTNNGVVSESDLNVIFSDYDGPDGQGPTIQDNDWAPTGSLYESPLDASPSGLFCGTLGDAACFAPVTDMTGNVRDAPYSAGANDIIYIP